MQNCQKLEAGSLVRALALMLALPVTGGCSLRTLAVDHVANVISGGGSTSENLFMSAYRFNKPLV